MEVSQIQQTAQSPKQPESKSLYDKLATHHQAAIDFRLSSMPYRMIKEKLKEAGKDFNENSIRQWFSKDGVCYPAYHEIYSKRLEDLREELTQLKTKLDSVSMEALDLLQQAMYDPNISEQQIKTAQDLLDRSGVPKQTKVESSGKFESSSLDKMAEAIKVIAEGKIAPPQK